MDAKEANEIIKPPVPELDEKDHKIAMMRYVIDCMWDKVYDIYFDIENVRPIDVEDVRKSLSDLFENKGFPEDIEDEGLLAYAEAHSWNEYKSFLNDSHCGDCTAVPATCSRCYTESYYGFETRPKDKATGHKALFTALKVK